MVTDIIRVSQLPVIEERLLAVKAEWEQKAIDAASMVCTEDTVQTIKKERAELRKEYEAADECRKAAKRAYMGPWDAVEVTYISCITTAYKAADAAYKAKIDEVEGKQKDACETRCREYFSELCAVHGVPWLQYEQAGLKISLTEAKKKTPTGHFDALNLFVSRVATDMEAITDPEVAAEYKSNGLSLAKAEKAVADRRAAAERERMSAALREELKKRQEEAVKRVEEASALAPPVVVGPKEQEKLLTVMFRATATREKLVRLREWMKAEGIKYE